eukprot:3135899-Prymnesium_polylepis.1
MSVLAAEFKRPIDRQVEAPGHGKYWTDGKTGGDKNYCKRKMWLDVTPEAEEGPKRMCNAAKIENARGELEDASPAAECVRHLQAPEREAGVKS